MYSSYKVGLLAL